MYVVFDGTAFLAEDTRFGEISEYPPLIFRDEQPAVTAASQQNDKFNGFYVEAGELVRARPWKAYRMVEVGQ